MPLNLLLGREGESWTAALSVSVQGYRGTGVFHDRVLQTEAVELTPAASAQRGDAHAGCFIILNHAKRTGRAERRLERAAVLFFADKHRSRYYASQGLACSLCVFLASTASAWGYLTCSPRLGTGLGTELQLESHKHTDKCRHLRCWGN